MSKSIAMKAASHRETLAKVVKMLTNSDITVQFRGHKPFVEARGNKAVRLVLPELNDDAPQPLLEAINGFLDHEVGHIFYTPFGTAMRFLAKSKQGTAEHTLRAALSNIVEDIRLEKLLPRDLPGTKENLERMHEKALEFYFGPPTLEAVKSDSESQRFCACIVVGMRALAGQKAFKKFMDDNDLWPHLRKLLTKMPDLARRLREMEDYADVQDIVDDILTHIAPPPEDDQQDDEDDQQPPAQGQSGDEDEGDDDTNSSMPGDQEDDDEDDNAGSGSGEGEDDEDGDDEDDCAGKGKGAGDGDEDSDDEDGDEGDDTTDTGANNFDKGDSDSDAPGDGKRKASITDALKQLQPDQRKAIFLYKKHKLKVEEIAEKMQVTEDRATDLLASARRNLKKIMNGG